MDLVGKKAPAFTLLNTKKEPVSLESYRGKKVVLAFFPAAFTGVCEKELCTFRDSLADLGNLNANVLAVSVDAPFSNGAFAQRNNLNFPVLSDYARTTVRDYGVTLDDFAGMKGYTAAQRAVFVINGEGQVTWQWIAANPGQEPNYDDVKKALKG